jgi:tetratricopeptide (TPR) repeat protein
VAAPLAVDVMEPGEAVAFLLHRTGSDDEAAAGELAEELGGLPLALAQAAAYAEEVRLSLVEYLARYRRAYARLLAEGTPHDYPAPVATTWRLNMEQVAAASPAAVEVLGLGAFLAPETIPLELLTADREALPAMLATALRDEDALDEPVRALLRYSLVARDQAGIRLHRFVQAVVRAELSRDQTSAWVTRAVDMLLAAFPHQADDPQIWPRSAVLLPHALAAAGHAESQLGATAPTGALLNQVGIYLAARAELPAARETLERALAITEAVHGPNHLGVVGTLENLGIVLRNLGDLGGARQHLQRALTITEPTYGPDHPNVALTLSNLGLILHALGDLDGACHHLQRALTIRQKVYGPDHPDVARSLDNLSLLLWDLGDLGRARRAQERALAALEATYGPVHPEVARTLTNLGNTLSYLGDHHGARQLFQRALAIDTAVYGSDHPEVACALTNLGSALKDLGDLEGARRAQEQALGITEAVYGSDHPEVAISLGNLGNVLLHQGDLDDARRAQERALAIKEAVYGLDHPDVARTLTNLGLVLHALGDPGGARQRIERALMILTGTLGAEHPDTHHVEQLLNEVFNKR